MALSEPSEILLGHDRWATGKILHACRGLTEDEFGRGFEMGPGSLRATLTHMIAAMNTWTDTLAGRTPGPRIDDGATIYALATLERLADESSAAFAAEARRLTLSEAVTRERGGKVFTFTRGAILTHVATHGMHHRAQCLNMLKHLGVKPLPTSSVVEWMREQG